jgi:hypothetical protein
MKNNLWKLVLFLFMLLVFAHEVHASFEKIIKIGLFEIYEDTIIPDCEQYLLDETTKEYKSYLKKERAMRVFIPLIVEKRYYFQTFPEFKLYKTQGSNVLMSGRGELPFSCALINCIDSSLYFFGGDTISFNILINTFLPKIIKNDLIKDLISLYLYSLSTEFSHYPLFSINNYEDIWISYNLELDNDLAREHREKGKTSRVRQMMILSEEEVDEDIVAVNRIIKNYSMSIVEDSKVAEIYTWEELDGEIEFWRFKINNESFRILERKTIAKKFGPFKWWVR